MVPPASDWTDAVTAAAGAEGAPSDGKTDERLRQFLARLPVGYRERTEPVDAASDLVQLDALERMQRGADAPPEASRRFGGCHLLTVRPGRDDDSFRLRRIGDGSIELTAFLPVVESFGLAVVEAVPFKLRPAEGSDRSVYIDDFGLRSVDVGVFEPAADGDRLVEAMEAVARGDCDVDSLNRLVTGTGLHWRQVALLRAYRRYRRQAATAWTDDQLDDALVGFPPVARALVAYFAARFDPAPDDPAPDDPGPAPADPAPDPDGSRRQAAAAEARRHVLDELGRVPRLQQDQILRAFLGLVDATSRTNWFQRDGSGQPRRSIALKLDSARVPELGPPRPLVETFVHGPEVEGIHVRAGLIARGGIRWSDRPGDFRTEVLDLAQAQVKKNAIIVPTGAKGGFVCRGVPPGTTPDVVGAYRAFIDSLLDVTDNLVAGRVVVPAGVVAADGEDPYLVVAADRGTARFSDVANALSDEHGFWLGDAFASGGSHGYDHKAMGITARGAWVAVRRHFRQLGTDVQTEPVRVVGVGDMSGDVFGNGMLRSRAIRLIGAFDHGHVFIDPDPDAEASFVERSRLAALERSSWADYDRGVLSPGGGVWSRDVKVIPLSPPVQRALGTTEDWLSPPEVISLLLAAPVDLLWFGGIGTYIKAPVESDSDVADHANDAVRITVDRVRARVIAEGANLGITSLARIRYSRRGGRINSDFIDNAAGVATSDREVNLKILLTLAVEEGRLDPAERDGVLASVEDDVAFEVLRQVDHSVSALDRAVPESARALDAYEALLCHLEADGIGDREVDSLPHADEIEVRRQAGAGWIRPELAVLLAFAKSDLERAIEASALVTDPSLIDVVRPYFPDAFRERFDDLIGRHRLYPQLVATSLAGELVDQLGPIWAHETAEELDRPIAEVAGAFWAARQVLDAGTLWVELERAAPGMAADAEAACHALLADAVSALARRYLRAGAGPTPHVQIDRDGPAVRSRIAARGAGAPGEDAPMEKEALDHLVGLGVDRERAAVFLARRHLAVLADAAAVSRAAAVPIDEVFHAFDAIDRAAGVDRLILRVEASAEPGRSAAWLARTLRDDIEDFRRQAVASALTSETAPDEAVAAWEGERQAALRRTGRLLAGDDGLAGVALAVHSLRDVLAARPGSAAGPA